MGIILMHEPPHPGGILRRMYLEPLGVSVTDASQTLKISRKQLSLLLNGHSGVSPIMALRLSQAFDTTPELWINLQCQYELWLARKSFREEIPSLRKELVVSR